MPHQHCERGEALETVYRLSALRWVDAETRKRMALAVSTGVKTEEWREIARGATDARSDNDAALWDYIDHVVDCPECRPNTWAHRHGISRSDARERGVILAIAPARQSGTD